MVFGVFAALQIGFGGVGNVADPRLAEVRRNLAGHAGQMSKFGGSECALIKKGTICNEAVRGEPVS